MNESRTSFEVKGHHIHNVDLRTSERVKHGPLSLLDFLRDVQESPEDSGVVFIDMDRQITPICVEPDRI
eukprot:CAMPEP_0206542380 /NCGR_PEP_ID=MMETSP0325_2-20121206/10134_1 /ASSEMBLY_ACC=CAM_ASM_000347 /TAXON_ID=2866 /ORGANISM="Crypthecodinium cohnii, Strain Seligo" /LENGTH=68 /DNA_ID=CAMNT_0054040419 /DNA_START=313 /DNA_END=519 /DNA_ORIENTATION=-